jgi:putative ABC transport system ATP-binding protein
MSPRDAIGPEPATVGAAGAAVAADGLRLRDVIKIYRSGPVETVALRGLSLEAAPGELIALLGPSGCGKSTVLSLCAGLDQPSAGEVWVGGRHLARLSEAEVDALRAREVAMVLQSGNLWSWLSARSNVVVGCRLAGVAEPERAADEALESFGMTARAEVRAGALSGGEQQRVAVAAAYARTPRLVLADEPTGELDTGNERRVLDALVRLRDESHAAVVVVTHSERVAETSDRVLEMRDGQWAA